MKGQISYGASKSLFTQYRRCVTFVMLYCYLFVSISPKEMFWKPPTPIQQQPRRQKILCFLRKMEANVMTCTRIIFVKIKSREIIINTTTVFRIEFDFVLCDIVAEWIPTLTNILDNTTDGPVHLNRPYLYILYDMILYTHPFSR